MQTVILRCKHCGAELELSGDRRLLFCPYCGEKTLLIIPSDQIQAERIRARTTQRTQKEMTERERIKATAYTKINSKNAERDISIKEAEIQLQRDRLEFEKEKQDQRTTRLLGFLLLLACCVIAAVLGLTEIFGGI